MDLEIFADEIKIHQETENSFTAEFTLSGELSVFEGHFSGNPIMPGVAYIFLAEKLTSSFIGFPLRLMQLKRTKFYRVSKPNDMLNIQGNISFDSAENIFNVQVIFSDNQMQRISLVRMIMEKKNT